MRRSNDRVLWTLPLTAMNRPLQEIEGRLNRVEQAGFRTRGEKQKRLGESPSLFRENSASTALSARGVTPPTSQSQEPRAHEKQSGWFWHANLANLADSPTETSRILSG